jgi:hypothetical protein
VPAAAASSAVSFFGRRVSRRYARRYVVTTILAALANVYAASLNFVGAESVKVVADRVRVSRKSMVPLGTLLAFGAVGLLAGFAVPALGTAAAIGLVLYFICAVTAHLRVRDRHIGGAVFFLLLAAGGPRHERRLPQLLVTV